VWLLAGALMLQGLGAALSMVRGPAHHHVDAVLHWLGAAHALAHELGIAHHHRAHEPKVLGDASALDLDDAVLPLLLGAALPAGSSGLFACAATEARPGCVAAQMRTRAIPPPRRPPRG
jgi:hypothetical protein